MKLLITGAVQWTDEQKEKIRSLGNELIYAQDERIPLSRQGIEESAIEAVICNALFVYNDIKKFTSLKYIQLTSAGYDRAPMDFIRKSGIRIYNARGVYSVPMAEFALCGALQLYKKSGFFFENQKRREWVKQRKLRELFGKSVCIVGCGSVGEECAKRFQAFGCGVTGIDTHVFESKAFREIKKAECLKSVLKVSDIVVLTLPLTEDTYHLMGREEINAMKAGSILINIARGAVVDTAALLEGLRNHLLGAALDVFETEPLEESPLWELENVILTPHNSFVGEGNNERLMNVIIENLERNGNAYRS